ncbi:hypothetical protein DEJ50_12250 [Streptomyces venezuelae]|uniref:Lipoprotein n=1 Tax=Streptomyces venezuelae TaxID=54571 RepID=A0A5P2D000_STRVZ|nr:hypothetical protein [Streptomyces venezuelae]QES48474.1 hypothetical protein DEJ50_12250 [Streptomyces venezuelae]
MIAAYRRFHMLGCGFAVLVLATGCSTSEPSAKPEPKPEPAYGSAVQICQGLFGPEGAAALERVLDSTEFRLRDETYDLDLQAVGKGLQGRYETGQGFGDLEGEMCRASGRPKAGSVPYAELWIAGDKKHVGAGEKDRGPAVIHGANRMHLRYNCASPRVGSTDDLPLQIRLTFRDKRDGRKGADVLRPDYVAVMHSAALAIAKDLGCQNSGGLPDRSEDLPASVPEA